MQLAGGRKRETSKGHTIEMPDTVSNLITIKVLLLLLDHFCSLRPPSFFFFFLDLEHAASMLLFQKKRAVL